VYHAVGKEATVQHGDCLPHFSCQSHAVMH